METRIQSVAHLVVSLYAAFLLLEGVRRRREIERFSYVSIVNAGIAAWNFLLFLYYSLDTPNAVYIVSQLGFVSVNVAIFGLFFFSWRLSFGRTSDHLIPLFAIVPAITCLLSVTSSFHSLFLSGHSGFSYLHLRELIISNGPWFIVHSIYSYVLITVSLILLGIVYLKERRKNRIAKLLFVVSTMTFSIFLFLSNFTRLKSMIQPYAFIGHLFCVSVFYWATFLDKDDSVIYYGKNRFYDSVGMPVLMFNEDGELLHVNDDAQRYFDKFNFPVAAFHSHERIFNGSLFSQIDIEHEVGDDASFFIKNTQNDQTLYVQYRDIRNRRDIGIGYSLTLYDLSLINSFVKKLENRAYIDELCQCMNRNCFEQQRHTILVHAPRPLALFIADIDNLKDVNDRFGHAAGDEYIRSCVDIMKKVMRSADLLFRIGGDEFAFFISGLDEAGLLRVQKALVVEFAALDKEYPCSLSVGYSVIGEGDYDFEKHFSIADTAMYQQKRATNRSSKEC